MTSSRIATLRWDGRCLQLIDQRVLPMQERYVACARADDVVAAIRDMVVRGAPAIGCAAAYGVALEAIHLARVAPAQLHAELESALERLASSRPTAVNLAWALQRMRERWTALSGHEPKAIAHGLLDEAHAIVEEDIAANRRMGALGAALIADGAQILTHCNAGALATAGHGTALGVIRSAIEAGKTLRVFADETRPFLQGARLTAWELSQDGIDVTLIADVAAGHLISRGEVNVVIVGADRIVANGDTANKIGTYTLAVLARRHGIPFYVAAPVSTIDPALPSGDRIPIEERTPDEVTGFREHRWAPTGVAVRNPAFDVTPAELISAIVTERGVVAPVNELGIRRLLGG